MVPQTPPDPKSGFFRNPYSAPYRAPIEPIVILICEQRMCETY